MRSPHGRERRRPTTLPTISSSDCHSVRSAPPPADEAHQLQGVLGDGGEIARLGDDAGQHAALLGLAEPARAAPAATTPRRRSPPAACAGRARPRRGRSPAPAGARPRRARRGWRRAGAGARGPARRTRRARARARGRSCRRRRGLDRAPRRRRVRACRAARPRHRAGPAAGAGPDDGRLVDAQRKARRTASPTSTPPASAPSHRA